MKKAATRKTQLLKKGALALSGERKGSRMRVKPTAIWGMSVNCLNPSVTSLEPQVGN